MTIDRFNAVSLNPSIERNDILFKAQVMGGFCSSYICFLLLKNWSMFSVCLPSYDAGGSLETIRKAAEFSLVAILSCKRSTVHVVL